MSMDNSHKLPSIPQPQATGLKPPPVVATSFTYDQWASASFAPATAPNVSSREAAVTTNDASRNNTSIVSQRKSTLSYGQIGIGLATAKLSALEVLL